MIETTTFAEWLAEGQKDVAGSISHVNVKTRYLLLRPDAFPDKTLYAGIVRWTDSQRYRARLEGRVVFDVPAQDPPMDRNATACKVRIQDSAKRNGGGVDALL